MDVLRRADRRVLWLGLGAWLAICLVGSFWSLGAVESTLQSEASEVASLRAADGATIEFNGRDGYLTVAADTPNPEQIASDIADLRGVRDVEIEVLGPILDAEPAAARTPAAFDVAWTTVSIDANGAVPDGSGADFNQLFGTGDQLVGDRTVELDPSLDTALRTTIAPLIGDDLIEGSLSVADNRISLTGVAIDSDTLERLESELGDINGLVLDLSAPAAPDASEPATFEVTWTEAEITQSGTAPDSLGPAISALGVSDPSLDSELSVGDNVEPVLRALAPLIGTDLATGGVSVMGGAVVVAGTATDAAALDRATAALADVDAEVSLSLGGDGAAQSALDRLLALDKIEFVSNTATPTPQTEAIIDEVAATLTEFPDATITVIGHTDARGDAAANQALSEQRAETVVNGLIERGISPERLQATGRGETEPLDTNDTLAGQQTNRRVEIDVEESA